MGSTAQTKTGNLIIEGSLTTGSFTMLAGAGADKVLTTDASGVASWQTATAGATPGGSTGYVQFASSTSFAGDSNLFWDNTNKRLGIGTTTPSAKLDVVGNIYGWNVPRAIKATSATHNGNFGGYQPMYNWIQSNGCSGYHVCDTGEIIRMAQLLGYQSWMPYCWYNGGANYDKATNLYGDCWGWQKNDSIIYGPVWIDGSKPYTFGCNNAFPVCCCL